MKKIAIIGSGIAGLTCAYYLKDHYAVTVFEANDYIGGHTHTVDVEWQGEKSAIDTGFIVFNDRTYPNFIRLLNELNVAYQATEMSFSVRNDLIGLEYNGHNLNRLFAQRKNLFSPAFWRMLKDIVHFNKAVRQNPDPQQTIGQYLDTRNFGTLFRDSYLLPMIAAIWSMGLKDSRDFPLEFFVRFFENHGLLNVSDRPQWYSITGGSKNYIPKLTAGFKDSLQLSTPVRKLSCLSDGIRLSTDHDEVAFDEVILACHADEALAMLAEPSTAERDILGAIPFSKNLVTLHTDTSLLPKNRRAWASWNYQTQPSENNRATLTYNMNILQRLKKSSTYLVTLNQAIDEDKVLKRFTYTHPSYNSATLAAQQRWQEISGHRHLHYCGAYWFNGFHEDGVRSALRVCQSLGVTA